MSDREMTWRTASMVLAIPAAIMFFLAALFGWEYSWSAFLYGAAYLCRSQADQSWRR